jgi:hypothetical protein
MNENQNISAAASNGAARKSIAVLCFVVIILVTYYAFLQYQDYQAKKEDQLQYDAFRSGILGDDPTLLQNTLVEDLKAGVNDKYTKSAAYFVTHRFFDNGGNIYEVYDYINSHPELAFLKEAESKYPATFEQLHKGEIPKTYSDRSFYIYLAYVEVLYKYGYTDVAAVSTLANQYAKLAYFNTLHAQEMSPEAGARRARFVPSDTKRAWQFLEAAKPLVDDVLQGRVTDTEILPRDILVGLNQYAAATRYMQALLETSTTSELIPEAYKNSREIFDYAMEYSRKKVPELTLFTSLLNASTLALISDSTPEEVKAALFPVLDYDPTSPTVPSASITYKILDSRLEPAANPGDTNFDLYSKSNILRLASIVPEFKNWLLNNGWQESDF